MNFFSFFGYVAATSFTPGPNTIMSMSTAGKYGFKRAFRFCLGVFIGFFTVLLLAAAFASVLREYIAGIEIVMKIIGAAYILYLAYVILRDKPREKKESKRKELRPDSTLTGIAMQFINPKGILYAITSMSSFVLPYYEGKPLMILLFAGILAGVALASTVCWALCGSVFERIFTKHKKVLNIVLALLLVYCAVSLFL